VTRVDCTQLSPVHQALIKKQSHASERFKKPREPKPTAFGEEFDSQLEIDFATSELEARRIAGLLSEWRYHPMRFRIGHNVTYTPDFVAVCRVNDLRSADLAFYEVKGSWASKNARDSRTRLQVAAYMYRWFNWYAVTRGKDGLWHYETIHANDALDCAG
jgi:hypothetical protein